MLNAFPADNIFSVKIDVDIHRVGGSGSIGNEWIYKHYLNDQEFLGGDILAINPPAFYKLASNP